MSATTKLPAKDKKKINRQLDALCREYHVGIPCEKINSILGEFQLKMEDGIYCGWDGEMSEHVGQNTYIRMTWHKMPSGKFEIVAYVS